MLNLYDNLESVNQELSYRAGQSSCQVLYDQCDSICCKLKRPIHHIAAQSDKISRKNSNTCTDKILNNEEPRTKS